MDALASLLVRPEGKTLEHKRDLSSPQSVLRTLVAFANTAGGTLLIGVEDGTRDVVGVDDVLALEERLANLVADSIAPRLLPEIETHPWRQTQVIAATVHPGGNLPFYLKKLGREAGVYVRLGSTNRKADVAGNSIFGGRQPARATMKRRCRISTRKRSTSEPHPSCLQTFGAYAGAISSRCAS